MIRFLLLSLMISLSITSYGQKSVPSVEVQNLEGKQVDLQDQIDKDKLTILSFWATWCKPCKDELDAVSAVYDDWQKKYNVELVAVSIDDARTQRRVIPMIEQKEWPYTFLVDPNSNAKRALNFRVIPQTFLVDKDGKIIYSHTGYTPGAEFELEEKIKEARM